MVQRERERERGVEPRGNFLWESATAQVILNGYIESGRDDDVDLNALLKKCNEMICQSTRRRTPLVTF